jgi:hypothetical protein
MMLEVQKSASVPGGMTVFPNPAGFMEKPVALLDDSSFPIVQDSLK